MKRLLNVSFVFERRVPETWLHLDANSKMACAIQELIYAEDGDSHGHFI